MGLLFWTPRVLGILFAVFLGMSAMDDLSGGNDFWKSMSALFVHLMPACAMFVALAIAWRWALLGSILYGASAVCFVYWSWSLVPLAEQLSISGPLAAASVLFLLNWIYRKQIAVVLID